MKRLGIIGGMGPAAGARLFTRVTEMTAARTDQEHIDTILLSDPSVPDRTSYLSGSTDARDFVPILQEKARLLEMLGCEVLAMSCNTAHAGYSEIASAAPHTQFLHMPKETIQFVASLGCQHPIILATTGTIESNIFQSLCADEGIDCVLPSIELQVLIMDMIYTYLKAGKTVPTKMLRTACAKIIASGADSIILGCTELSLLDLGCYYGSLPIIDALDVLAWRCVQACGAPAKNLPGNYLNNPNQSPTKTTE